MTMTVWHYILTLGTYAHADAPLRMQTYAGTLTAGVGTGRAAVYARLRESLAASHPDLGLDDAVVIHSDIQPNTPGDD